MVGYGDLIPRSHWGRSVFLGMLLVGLGVITYLGSIVAEIITNQWRIHVENLHHEEVDIIDE